MDRFFYKEFYRVAHRLIFQAMLAIMQIGQPIDILTLTEELKKQDQLVQAGGENDLFELARIIPIALTFSLRLLLCRKKQYYANSFRLAAKS